ncbi:MAG TPA: thioredoxin domain-containing protein [Thermoanaerobaculia bacterium]|nr:thioredoxin domain-containing protein [Thermoanaerobaculia bacterium]
MTRIALLVLTLTFHVVGIDCDRCAPPLVKALTSVDGVKNARVDANAKTATVEVPDGFDREKLRTAVGNAGFEAVFPGEKPKDIEPLPAAVAAKLDIRTFADGRRVDLAGVLAPGKVTIVDFYADWCGPCRVLEARLQHLMNGAKPGLAVRRVNIGKWDNAAAKQATELRAEALPYIRVYDAHGKFVTAVTGGMWDEVLGAIEKAEQRGER